ncbi:mitochondrial fission 1 protein [Nannospalax galili]|uniref:mitochondrial fission 1 protein n=1 Tax=Nannospalax galili TaxID=1026970 RepID=UPI00111C58F6|nr:mitochondrial fission 1 protein [Nannospalax galili]
MEAVLNELVSVEDLKKFEKKFQSEQAAGSVSKSTQFEYAWCLVRSKYNDDIRKGILLLEGCSSHTSAGITELLPKGSKEEQRDYVFYLAVGNYRLKEYERALKYVRGLLQTEPQNNQAKELEHLIDKAMKKDGLVGMAIVGGMALGVAGLAGLIGLAVSKSKS